MYHHTTRVLAVLELLQAHGQLSGAELARRLGVDGRTIRRYVSVLEELGIPITAERGRSGGYSLVAGFKLPPMLFSDDEALAIALGLLAVRDIGLGAAPGVASARAKLERVMPLELRRRAQAIDQTVALELPAAQPGADSRTLVTLQAAVEAERRVQVVYRAANGLATDRELDPFGLAYRGGCWYLVGHCHLRGGQRTFRVDRMSAVRQLAPGFTRPAGLDVLAEVTRSIASLPRAQQVEVVLDTDLATARRELFAAVGVFEPTPAGLRLRIETDDLAWVARLLARLSFGFTIVSPVALRETLAAHARMLLAQCASTSGEVAPRSAS